MKSLSGSTITFLLLALLLATSSAFAPVRSQRHAHLRHTDPHGVDRSCDSTTTTTTTLLFHTPETNKQKKPYDELLRKKLLSESIAPWRTIRLFLYGSLGSGALVGGLIQLTGLLAALSAGKQDSIDMNTEVTYTLYIYIYEYVCLSVSRL